MWIPIANVPNLISTTQYNDDDNPNEVIELSDDNEMNMKEYDQ